MSRNHPVMSGPTPPVSAAPAPLPSVPVGSLVTLHEIRDAESRSLLQSLGLTSASRLRLCKVGDPCIVQVRATRIGISRAVAQSVYVLPDAGTSR